MSAVSQDDGFYYYAWIMCSFLTCMLIHHVISPFFFRRFNKVYREFAKDKRMEWDSRLVSSIHAITVSILCVSTLIMDREMWSEPITHASSKGLIALSISIGYFLCDMVSMPIYWRGKQLLIFLLHHAVAAVAFQQVVHYKMCAFFGVYRLTTELSTPFINQRWFYRTIGYKPDRKRVLSVTLAFAVLFAVTRNFMIVPFWYITYKAFQTPTYVMVKQRVSWLDVAFVTPSLILDCLNTYWAFKTYRIGWRAAKALWHADWKSDIRLAHAKLRRKLRRLRQRGQSEVASLPQPAPSLDVYMSADTAMETYIYESSSTSSYSSETEYEAASSDLDTPSSESRVCNTASNTFGEQRVIQRLH